jgi:hypothetical protein
MPTHALHQVFPVMQNPVMQDNDARMMQEMAHGNDAG